MSNVKIVDSLVHRNILLNNNRLKGVPNDYICNEDNYIRLGIKIENSILGIDYLPTDQLLSLDFKFDIANSNVQNVNCIFDRLMVSYDVELDFYDSLEEIRISYDENDVVDKEYFRKLFPKAKFIEINKDSDANNHYYVYDIGDGVHHRVDWLVDYHRGIGVDKSLYMKYLKTHKDEYELDRTIINLTNLETDFVSEISDDKLQECLLSINDASFDHNNTSINVKNKDVRLKLAKCLWDSKKSGINGREFPSLNMKKYYIDKFLYIEPHYKLTERPVENYGEFYFRSEVNIRTVEIEKIESTVSSEALEFIKNIREIDYIDDKKIYYVDKNGNHRTMKLLKVGRNTPDFVLLPRKLMR